MRIVVSGLLAFGFIVLTATAQAASVPPVIPAYERLMGDDVGDPEAGRLLIGELGCTACHPAADGFAVTLPTKQAPILTQVGLRVRPEWIESFLQDPDSVKPGTTMPHILHGMSPDERRGAAVALTHFLTGRQRLSEGFPDPEGARRGEILFHRSGCVACHQPRRGDAEPIVGSVPLGDPAAKYTVGSLAEFLTDPLRVRPSGRMPALGLEEQDYRDLASHFLIGIDVPTNVRFQTFHGDWQKLPDFGSMKAATEGESVGFDLTTAGKTSSFGIRFETRVHIPRDGEYTFHLRSDDGARLTIAGEVVVDLDGIHPPTNRDGKRHFTQGVHPLLLDYFQGGGEWVLQADISGPDLPRQALASFCALTDELPSTTDTFKVDPALETRGRELFTSLGCANCHVYEQDGQRLTGKPFAKPLTNLSGETGCLAAAPPTLVPAYGLSTPQRKDLLAALAIKDQDASPWVLEPEQSVRLTLAALNCYACHQRDEIGGVVAARDPFFETTMKEMGDEGRLPPTLTGIGDKLQTPWLKELLQNGTHDRHYMHARMPKFGLAAVGHLIPLWETLDRRDEVDDVTIDEPDYRVKADGRYLIGDKALSCIKCHDFAKYPATGIRAISLTSMNRRLREDWFHRYMLNPQKYRPGTRMPAPWPFGQSTIHEILEGKTDQQIAAVWSYLADGEKAALPTGLIREQIELVATETPILYRNFIEGAGPRAIGVGYPEKANLAFDANNLRLAMIWHGSFFDASRHWTGRGVGFEGPLGDHVLRFPDSVPIAALGSDGDPWPDVTGRTPGYEFHGYRLDERARPAFMYTAAGVNVVDRFLPVPRTDADPLLTRRLKFDLSGSEAVRYFRLAVAPRIETARETGTYVIDGAWQLHVADASDNVDVMIRRINGKDELLLRLSPGKEGSNLNETTATVRYIW